MCCVVRKCFFSLECFVSGAVWVFGEVTLSHFIPVSSQGLEQESSGALDLITKRAISTPDRKWFAGTSRSPDSAAGTACAGVAAELLQPRHGASGQTGHS